MGKKQEKQDKPEKKKEEKKGGGGSPPRRVDPKLSQIVRYARKPRETRNRRKRRYL